MILFFILKFILLAFPLFLIGIIAAQTYQEIKEKNLFSIFLIIVMIFLVQSTINSFYISYLKFTCDTVKIEDWCCTDYSFDVYDNQCFDYEPCLVDACLIGDEYIKL